MSAKKFKITKEKWEWAEPVEEKQIYRDEEYVITDTKEEALEAIAFLMNQAKGLTYTITVKRDDKYFTYFRHSMPCYGGLVKYRASHGEAYSMNPYFPRDIYVAFPEGEIIYIGIHRQGAKAAVETPYFNFIFSEESPWVSAFGNRESVIFHDNYFVLTNMDSDPTALYSIMRLGGFSGSGMSFYGQNTKDWNPKARILIEKYGQADVRRLAAQNPIKTSGGTWAQGFGYTRPYNESIFKTSLPHKIEQFKTLEGYPQADFSPTHFTAFAGKMKMNLTKKDKTLEEQLIEAWDILKEEGAKLE